MTAYELVFVQVIENGIHAGVTGPMLYPLSFIRNGFMLAPKVGQTATWTF